MFVGVMRMRGDQVGTCVEVETSECREVAEAESYYLSASSYSIYDLSCRLFVF